MAKRATDDTRRPTQDAIRSRFGQAAIDAATERLCKHCALRIRGGDPCNLLPIQSDGSDCPYFAATPVRRPAEIRNA